MSSYFASLVKMLGAFSELERDARNGRVRAGMEKSKAEGRHLGRAPVGTKVVDGQLVPVDVDALHERLGATNAAQQARDSGMTYRQLADLLNDRGWPTVSGAVGKWTATGARRLLVSKNLHAITKGGIQ